MPFFLGAQGSHYAAATFSRKAFEHFKKIDQDEDDKENCEAYAFAESDFEGWDTKHEMLFDEAE